MWSGDDDCVKPSAAEVTSLAFRATFGVAGGLTVGGRAIDHA